jgi:hypothetical protein
VLADSIRLFDNGRIVESGRISLVKEIDRTLPGTEMRYKGEKGLPMISGVYIFFYMSQRWIGEI